MTDITSIIDTNGGKTQISKDSLWAIVEDNLHKLSDIKRGNIKALSDTSVSSTVVYSRKPHVKSKHYSVICGTTANIPGLEEIKYFTHTMLEAWLLRQLKTLLSIEDNNLDNLSFINNINIQNRYGVITEARTATSVICDNCGHIVVKRNMSSHAISLACKQATNDRDLRQLGWKTLSGHHVAAIFKSGVQHDIRASGFTMWVPPWVESAINKYEKGEGYGGMTLSEFLSKLNG